MSKIWIFLTFFGLIVIIFPEFLAFLIGGFFLFIGLNILFFNLSLNSNIKNSKWSNKEEVFKFGKYTIYK